METNIYIYSLMADYDEDDLVHCVESLTSDVISNQPYWNMNADQRAEWRRYTQQKQRVQEQVVEEDEEPEYTSEEEEEEVEEEVEDKEEEEETTPKEEEGGEPAARGGSGAHGAREVVFRVNGREAAVVGVPPHLAGVPLVLAVQPYMGGVALLV